MRPDELPSTPGAGGAPRRWRSTRRCRTLSSNGWEYPPSQTNLNPSNRPVRTRMPGGVAGDADNLRAPMPIALSLKRGRRAKHSSGEASRENAKGCLRFEMRMRSSAVARTPSLRAQRSNPDCHRKKILECFAELVIGPRYSRTRWLAMTTLKQLSIALSAASRLDVGPSLFLQLHHPNDARLHHLRLRDNRDVLAFRHLHFRLG